MSATPADGAPELPTTPTGDPDAPTRNDPIRRPPILARLALTLVGVLIGMAVVDRAIARMDSDQGAEGGVSSIMRNPLLGWTNKPYFQNPEFRTQLDRFGLRNPQIPEDPPPDELRIVGFGASRVYGAGKAHQPWCWNYKLETIMQRELPHPVRVMNGGVMGYSGLQAVRRAGAFLDALEPDLVWVLVSPGAQMLLDDSPAQHWIKTGDGPEDVVPFDVLDGVPEFLQPIAVRLHELLNEYSGIYRRYRTKKESGGKRVASITKWRLTTDPMSRPLQEILNRTLDEISALQRECEERGIELRILVFPEQQNDSERAWRDFLVKWQPAGAPPLDTPRTEPTDELQRILEERGIRVWNFFDELDRMGKDRKSFVMEDSYHWSELGHTVIARGIFRRLTEEGSLSEMIERRKQNPRTRPYGEVPFKRQEQLEEEEPEDLKVYLDPGSKRGNE